MSFWKLTDLKVQTALYFGKLIAYEVLEIEKYERFAANIKKTFMLKKSSWYLLMNRWKYEKGFAIICFNNLLGKFFVSSTNEVLYKIEILQENLEEK